MTKKDYQAIAKIISLNTSIDDPHIVLKKPFILGLCDMFKEDNQRFNKDKFLEAVDF